MGIIMNCPMCRGKLRVIDTGSTDSVVYRRRKCDDCGFDVYTEEREAKDALSAYMRLYDARYKGKRKEKQ